LFQVERRKYSTRRLRISTAGNIGMIQKFQQIYAAQENLKNRLTLTLRQA